MHTLYIFAHERFHVTQSRRSMKSHQIVAVNVFISSTRDCWVLLTCCKHKYHGNLTAIVFWHNECRRELYCRNVCDIFNIATHSNFGTAVKLQKWTSCPLWSASMRPSGEQVTSSGADLLRTPSRCEKNPEKNTTLWCRNAQSTLNVYCYCL